MRHSIPSSEEITRMQVLGERICHAALILFKQRINRTILGLAFIHHNSGTEMPDTTSSAVLLSFLLFLLSHILNILIPWQRMCSRRTARVYSMKNNHWQEFMADNLLEMRVTKMAIKLSACCKNSGSVEIKDLSKKRQVGLKSIRARPKPCGDKVAVNKFHQGLKLLFEL
eukprot:768815-Hanusia_phi.AAC.7